MDFRTKKQIFGAAIILSATFFASIVIAKEAVTVKDVNFDSIPDVVVSENGQLTTFLGNGDGTFKKAQKSVSTSTWLPALQMTAPFSITFDMQGNPIVLGANGKIIPPSRVTFPIKDVKAIANVNTITAIEVYGSHYYVLKIGGDNYVIDLPPPHPSQ